MRVLQVNPQTAAMQARLRERRRAVGLYSATLAQLAGMSASAYSALEVGWTQAKPEQIRTLDNILLQYERALARIHRANEARSLACAQA